MSIHNPFDETGLWEDVSAFKHEPIKSKIYAYFTPAITPELPNKYGTVEEEKCKPEHRVEGKVPFQNNIELDGKVCDCGRMKYVAELCGCDMKQYILKQIPNE